MKVAITAAILGALIAGVFLVANEVGLFTFPNPISVVNVDTNNFCQKSLDFGRTETGFVFYYKNLGKDNGVFEASIRSNEVLSKYKNTNQPLQTESSYGWTVEKDKMQSFEFVLAFPNSSEEPETISIETSMSCKKSVAGIEAISCGNIKQICTYQNKHMKYFGPEYELIS